MDIVINLLLILSSIDDIGRYVVMIRSNKISEIV